VNRDRQAGGFRLQNNDTLHGRILRKLDALGEKSAPRQKQSGQLA
jgi:hypothetical protein